MFKKAWIWILAVIIIVVGVILIVQNTGSNQIDQNKEPIKIGVIGHFSGEYASYIDPMRKAVELADNEINQTGGIGGRKVELVFGDDATDKNTAATEMNKLVSVDNVDYILSAQSSSVTSAVTPIAQNNQRILMITLGSAPELTATGDYIFRSVPSDTYQGIKIVDLINNDLNSKKVAGLYLNDAYGLGIRDLVDANQKVENVDSEMFDAKSTDFKTQLLKIKQSGADTLVIVAHLEYPLILKQIKELDLNLKIIVAETFKNSDLLGESGSSAEDIIAISMAEQKDYVDFVENYKNKYSEEPNDYAMYAYDGFIAITKAIEKLGDNVGKVKNNLYDVKFNGASGVVGFDSDRNRTGIDYDVFTVKDDQFVPYE